MTTEDIIKAINAGILTISGHSLPVEHYYKLFKFKRVVKKAYDAFADAEAAMLKDAGIRQDEIHQKDGRVIVAPKKDDGSPDLKRLEVYKAGMKGLMDEEIDLSGIIKIPAEYFKGLYDENRREENGRIVDILGTFEMESFVMTNLFCEEQVEEKDKEDEA